MQQYVFEVSLQLRAPVLSQATGGRKHGLDTVTVRDDHDIPSLLGSSIRGNLRHAWLDLAKASGKLQIAQIEEWLGTPSLEEGNNSPQRARLSFSYYWQAQQKTTPNVRHRISIDEKTGAVQEGALQVIESPFITGEIIEFTGEIYALSENEEELKNPLFWLRKGLNYIPALGALRGVGFGRVEKIRISEPKLTKTSTQAIPKTAQFGIALKLDRPFCFAKHHSKNNHFSSDTFITGGAILGVLSRYLKENSVLKTHFDKIKISHAFPSANQKRPLATPQSFVGVKIENETKVYDLSLKNKAGLIHGKAPAFSPDWKKEWGIVTGLCGQVEPSRSVHTHTAITEKGEQDEDGRLFSMEVIHPNNYQWLANVNCEQVPEVARPQVLQELHQLFSQGLHGLGKTKASARVNYCETPYEYALAANHLPEKQGETFVLMLQTPALLLPNPYDIPPSNGGTKLREIYTAVWNALAGEQAFKLSHFYARQQLVGGAYLQQRFWSEQAHYNPAILTSAGSVFVFTVENLEKTHEILARWLADGLPQHSDTFGGENWQQNPYIANNGYGEIVINPQWKTTNLESAWEELA